MLYKKFHVWFILYIRLCMYNLPCTKTYAQEFVHRSLYTKICERHFLYSEQFDRLNDQLFDEQYNNNLCIKLLR